ncbi:4-(cytidine 5'-diphospho)-2-C-methyl-D-erythritol kinase [Kytococcus sedentarius]|uniref:4-(cytidine 5'-diphospho)-2-C-methyl-D-erythritol kinase n=1 Tax=Kytococcus sedentarius TaxID=1276 RepID=UPI0035BC827B
MTAEPAPRIATVRVPAKVNLALRVGAPKLDNGYHPLATVFHAVDLTDEVTVRRARRFSLEVTGRFAEGVPTDHTNLAWRAVELLRDYYRQTCGVRTPLPVAISIEKNIPVAGGMAGGSADAAGALLAANTVWGNELMPGDLSAIAEELGADVPFALLGGNALGVGRGDELSTVLAQGQLHWVFCVSDQGLSTPEVYRTFDRLSGWDQMPTPETLPAWEEVPEPPEDLLQALRSGDAVEVGQHLENDLQAAAVELQPGLRDTLAAGADVGALAGIVSGSGPTIALLAASHDHAIDISVGMAALRPEVEVFVTSGPAPGARVVSTEA